MSNKDFRGPFRIYRSLENLPLGRWLFTRLICLRAPYFSSISPLFMDLRPGRAVVSMRKRRKVKDGFGWEPVRKGNSAGRLVAGFAYDATFGRPTTREFANTQRLVETPNDLDTDPDLRFATLGLLLWEHEWWTGPDGCWGMRAGQI